MNKPLSFFIAGTPAPGGSKTAFALRRGDGTLVMRPDGKTPVINITDAGGDKNKQWKKDCALQAKGAMRGAPMFSVAIEVTFEFRVTRPRSHFRANGNLRPDAPVYPSVKPDVLKFSRSTEDALTSICWTDDALIVREHISKIYTDQLHSGCHVTIALMPDEETLIQ